MALSEDFKDLRYWILIGWFSTPAVSLSTNAHA